MSKTLDEVMAGLSPASRKRIEKRAAELIAEELSLRARTSPDRKRQHSELHKLLGK